MKLKHVKFKVTTNKSWKCHVCQKKVKGQDGFIEHLLIETTGMSAWGDGTRFRICWSCFKEFLEQCSLDRKLRKEKYRDLEKKAIIRNLEK